MSLDCHRFAAEQQTSDTMKNKFEESLIQLDSTRELDSTDAADKRMERQLLLS